MAATSLSEESAGPPLRRFASMPNYFFSNLLRFCVARYAGDRGSYPDGRPRRFRVYNAGLRSWRAAMATPSFSQVVSVCSLCGNASFAAVALARIILSNCENIAGLTAILRLLCSIGRRQNSRDPAEGRGPNLKLKANRAGRGDLSPKTKVFAQEELGPEQLDSSVDMCSAEPVGRPPPDSSLKSSAGGHSSQEDRAEGAAGARGGQNLRSLAESKIAKIGAYRGSVKSGA